MSVLPKSLKVLIIGAGPAGLTAGYELVKNGANVVIIEAYHKVGGISRTEEYNGYKFDIGGHRFFTKNKKVQKFWNEVLGEDFLLRPRKSRIFYNGTYFNYPLTFTNALWNLGVKNSCMAVLSYLFYKIRPIKPEKSYSDWMTNRFGKVLFDTFFKTYTEKVWGISVHGISKDWASQRVKQLSLFEAIKDSIFKNRKNTIKTLIEEFYYPKFGPGEMWEAVAENIETLGGKIIFDTKAEKLVIENGKWSLKTSNPEIEFKNFDHIVSTMPLKSLIHSLKVDDKKVIQAADDLKYRDFITVLLIINKENIFDDNWIYIHDKNSKVGRIQNYKNWSQWMVPDSGKTSLGLEYFLFENDEFWNLPDSEILEIAKKEVSALGMCSVDDIEDGTVLREKKAYPIYDERYKKNLRIIRNYLQNLENLHTIGRNGMHRYNNQDHSMYTGMITAKNIFSGSRKRDPWNVNNDAEYLEEMKEEKGRLMPKKLKI